MFLRAFVATCAGIVFSWLATFSSATAAPAKSTNLRVGLPSALSSNWPLYTAVKRGFFHEEGLNVELIVLRRSTLQIQAMIAEDVPVSQFSVDGAARAFTAGAPIRYIGAAQQKPAFRLIVDKELKRWEDLKGKVLATGAAGGITYSMLLAMLDANAIKKDEVKLLSMGTSNDRSQALRARRVQGTLLSAPDDFALLDEGFVSLGFVGEFVKDLEYNGYIVNDHWAKRNREIVISFMRVMVKATRWLHHPANKEEAIKILAGYIPFKPKWLESVYEMAIQNKMLSTDCWPAAKGIENTLQLSVRYGIGLTSMPAVNSWLDLSYLDSATASTR
jgi:ABC-type nitrate/sulfonate/bicarbonate transport system substrate-binding protein